MSNIDKKISVITIVKNGIPYIKSAIKSFNLQNYSNKELVIIYSSSKDGTEEYLKTLNQENIIIKKDEISKNRYGAINLGIKTLSGEIFGILHSDDVFYSENILSIVSKNINKDVDCLYGNIIFSETNNLNKIKRIWKSNKFKKNSLKYGWMPPHTSIFMKTKFVKNNFYNEEFFISSDYHFILNIFNNNKIKIKFIDEFITIMRMGGDSTKLKNFYIKLAEDLKVCKIFFKNHYICVALKIIRKIFQIQILNKTINNNYINTLNT